MKKEAPKYIFALSGILVMSFLFAAVPVEITGNYAAQPTKTSSTIWTGIETLIVLFIITTTAFMLYTKLKGPKPVKRKRF